MRKEKGFEVADKIKLYISGNQMLASVIDKYKDTILKETLTTEIISDDKNADYTESIINGETINIDVKVV